MGILGRSILFGTAFVLALVAVAFGLRKLRAAPEPTGRGPWVAVQRAFWSAAALLLGTTATGCPTANCYEPAPGDFGADADAEEDVAEDDAASPDEVADPEDAVAPDDGAVPDDGVAMEACYADLGPLEDGGDADEDADVDAVEPEVSGETIEPDVMCYDPVEFDATSDAGDGVDAGAPDAPKTASTADVRRARRALLRAQTVAAMLREPGTHPAVRETLRRDLDRLVRAVRKARRTLGKVA